MHLDRSEEAALAGEQGEVMQMAYRILVATGEATDAERLVPVKWVHLSGVNYNTIGDAGEGFLRSIRDRARVRVRTTLNPMGFDSDSVDAYGLSEEFVRKQESIRRSYEMMGVTTSFSCIPYDIFEMPEPGSQVAFAESNAAIHANSFDGLKTNKESAFSALASALTGKSPYSAFRGDVSPDTAIQMRIDEPTDLDWGCWASLRERSPMDLPRYPAPLPGTGGAARPSAGAWEPRARAPSSPLAARHPGANGCSSTGPRPTGYWEELSTAERGDLIVLGSPQLGAGELADLAGMLRGRRFKKECLVFCPRTVKEQAAASGLSGVLERARCRLLADCCACLTPLISRDSTDSVTTNSIKGAYYLGRSNGVGVELKPLAEIIRDETQ